MALNRFRGKTGWIRSHRNSMNVTVRVLSIVSGVSEFDIQQIEAGWRMPSFQEAFALKSGILTLRRSFRLFHKSRAARQLAARRCDHHSQNNKPP